MPFRREAVKPDTTMIQPAVTDAIFAGTRKRPRSLPIPGAGLALVEQTQRRSFCGGWALLGELRNAFIRLRSRKCRSAFVPGVSSSDF